MDKRKRAVTYPELFWLFIACSLLEKLSTKARVNAFGVDVSENMIASARK